MKIKVSLELLAAFAMATKSYYMYTVDLVKNESLKQTATLETCNSSITHFI